jgi:hypothetical protein
VVRELGAAFLSPDYDEVRSLLQRYKMPEQPVSAVNAMRFHSHYPGEVAAGDLAGEGGAGSSSGGVGGSGGGVGFGRSGLFAQHAVSPAAWADAWAAQITGDANATANALAVWCLEARWMYWAFAAADEVLLLLLLLLLQLLLRLLARV